MSRESTLPQSLLGNAAGGSIDLNSLPPSYHVLLQKQQEYAALQALKEASGDMVTKIEKLSEMSHVMADGGEALGRVMRNWPHVFSVLNLVDKASPAPMSADGSVQEEEQEPIPPLVRLPYTQESSTSQ